MQANEVPEKIYRTTTYLDNDRGKTIWKANPFAGAENIEYTRTDALVKNVCEWLKTNYTEFLDSSRLGINIDELVKDLKNDFKTE